MSIGVSGVVLIVGLLLLGATNSALLVRVLGLLVLTLGGVWGGFAALWTRHFIIGGVAYLVSTLGLASFEFRHWTALTGAIALLSFVYWLDTYRTSAERGGQGEITRRGWIIGLGALSVIVALLASVIAFFSWAYAGSEDFDVLITFGIAPWVATFFIFARRLAAGAVAYVISGAALIFAAAFRERWGMESVFIALVPLAMAVACAAVDRALKTTGRGF